MLTMATRAVTASAQDRTDSFRWSFPGAPVHIDVSLMLVSRLRAMLQNADAEYPPSLETGGLLLGKGSPGVIQITDVLPFSSPRQSRLFVLSPDERMEFQHLIDLQNDGELDVVGYFRTDARGGIRLDAADLALITELFSDTGNVFLIMCPDDDGTPLGGFFFWDSGSVFTESSFMSFPLDPLLLRAKDTLRPANNEGRTPGLPAVPRISSSPKRHASRWSSVIPVLLVFVAAAMAVRYKALFSAGAANALQEPAGPAKADNSGILPSPLALSASPADTQIAITWDVRLPAVT
jgi:hypothetical protein